MAENPYINNLEPGSYNPRLTGAGNTVVSTQFGDQGFKDLAFCQTISDTAPVPLTQETVVQGIGDKIPSRIVPPTDAFGAGKLVITVLEIWNYRVWEQLGYKVEADNGRIPSRYDLFKQQYEKGEPFMVKRVVKGPGNKLFIRTYKGCIITAIDDGEKSISLNSKESTVNINISYTHYDDFGRELAAGK